MAGGQDRDIRRHVAGARQEPAQPAFPQVEIFDPAREPDLSAQGLHLAPECADNQRQAVGAQVRTLLVEDRRLAVAIGQDLEDLEDVGAGHARGELAVAESAGSPFAEEVIALRIERPALVEAADVGDALLHGPAALEDQRVVAVLGQKIAGDQTGGAGADDDGPMSQRSRSGLGPVEPFGRVRLNVGRPSSLA